MFPRAQGKPRPPRFFRLTIDASEPRTAGPRRARRWLTRRRGGAEQSHSLRVLRASAYAMPWCMDGNLLSAERSWSATPTGLTVDDRFKHEIEILASPKRPTVGVARWRIVRLYLCHGLPFKWRLSPFAPWRFQRRVRMCIRTLHCSRERLRGDIGGQIPPLQVVLRRVQDFFKKL